MIDQQKFMKIFNITLLCVFTLMLVNSVFNLLMFWNNAPYLINKLALFGSPIIYLFLMILFYLQLKGLPINPETIGKNFIEDCEKTLDKEIKKVKK